MRNSYQTFLDYLTTSTSFRSNLILCLSQFASENSNLTMSSQQQATFEGLLYWARPVVIQVDASIAGLGVTHLQNDIPDAYAGKTVLGS